MRARSYLAVLVFVASIGAAEETTVILSAEPSQTKAAAFGKHADRCSLSATLRLTNINSSGGWSPGAHVSFTQSMEHRPYGKVEFFIIPNRETDHIVAGYRVLDNDREVKVELLQNLPLSASVQVTMKIDNGLVMLSVPPLDPITFQTRLIVAAPSASVSSGSVEVTSDISPSPCW